MKALAYAIPLIVFMGLAFIFLVPVVIATTTTSTVTATTTVTSYTTTTTASGYSSLTGAVYTSTTTTIVGWNVPNGENLTNGIVAFLLPIIMMGLFSGLPYALGERGDFITMMMMVGLLIGGLVAMLSISGTAPAVMPFAIPLVAGLYLVLWIWKGR